MFFITLEKHETPLRGAAGKTHRVKALQPSQQREHTTPIAGDQRLDCKENHAAPPYYQVPLVSCVSPT